MRANIPLLASHCLILEGEEEKGEAGYNSDLSLLQRRTHAYKPSAA